MFKSFLRMVAVVLIIITLTGCDALPETTNTGVQDQPEIYYIHDNKFIRQQPGQKSEMLLTLPDLGETKDALKIEGMIFVLRERGLQKVSIADKSVDLITQFANPVISGVLSADPNHYTLIFAVDDKVEIYDLGKQTTNEVFSQPGAGFFKPIGLTKDGKKLYLVPHSGDPEFPEILILNLNSGKIESFSIGIGYEAALSQNARYLAIASVHYIALEKPIEYGLTLFDLFAPQTSGRILPIPNSPSHVSDLIWSSDNKRVYFLLRPGTPYDDLTTSYGIWCWNVESETFSQVVAIKNPAMHLVDISPDGEWILLRPEVESSIDLVHIPTGKIETMLLPAGPLALVRWR
ncbi:MAG: hypothetical protein ACPL1K_01945 [Candidatus Kryptoniota bacterium]